MLGGVLGVWVSGQLSGQAEPAAPAQQREDQITIFSQTAVGPFIGSVVYSRVVEQPGFGSVPILLGLDSSDYPSSGMFRLEGEWAASGPSGSSNTHCVRLLDVTSNAPVTASEVCHTANGTENVRARSVTFTLPTGEHEYTLEAKCTCSAGATLFAARVIAEWTEHR